MRKEMDQYSLFVKLIYVWKEHLLSFLCFYTGFKQHLFLIF